MPPVSTSSVSPMSSTAAHTDTEKAKSKNKEVKRPSWLDIDNLDDGDMSKMGYVMDKETQAKWDAPPPNYLNKTVAEKLWLVTVRFPHHWVKHNLYCLPLVVASLVPLVVGMWHSRMLITTGDGPTLTGGFDYFEDHSLAPEAQMVQILKSFVGRAGQYVMVWVMMHTLWASEFVTPVCKRWIIPMYIVSCSAGAAHVLIKNVNNSGIPGLFFLDVLLILIMAYKTIRGVGDAVGGFGYRLAKSLMSSVIIFVIILIGYEIMVFPQVGAWSDLEKTIFSTILNPLIWELPLLYIRGISRTLAFNHSSTNYCLVGIIVAGKKATGRFVMATIYDPTYVTIASIVLSVIEIVFVVTVGARDRFLYRCCFGSKAGALGDDPLAPLKHHRNKKLRIQLANLETTLELVFIFMGVAFVGMMNVATIGDPEFGKAPTGGDLVLNGMIQYVMEMIVDFVGIAYLTAYANQAYLEYSHLYHKNYLKTMGTLAFFASSYVISNSIPGVLYRIAPMTGNMTCQTARCGHQADWLWLTEDLLESNSTFLATS